MRIMSPFMYCMSLSKVSAFDKRKNYVSEETGVYSNFSAENEKMEFAALDYIIHYLSLVACSDGANS